MKKKRISIILVLVMVVAMASTCFAAEYDFSSTKKFVDSNQWTKVGTAVKSATGTHGELKVTKMYDADKKESVTYQRVHAKATSDGTAITVIKGSWYDILIPASYRSAGSSIPLYCMGYVPFLDCYISGYWNVH